MTVGTEFSIFLKRYNAVYIDIAKVASSSIKATLARLLDLDGAEGNPHEVDFPRPTSSNPRGERIYPGLYAFGFVRNHWDRLVSCYRDKIGGEVVDFTGFAESGVAHCLARFDVFSKDMPFAEFVHAVASIPDEEADEHFRSQSDYLINSHGKVAVDFVGRYENLESDFEQVAREIGLPSETKLPRLQVSPTPTDYSGYYTPETRSVVEKRFARDIELFSFRFLSA